MIFKASKPYWRKNIFLCHRVLIVFALSPINEWTPLDISFHRCLCTLDNRYSEYTVYVQCFSSVLFSSARWIIDTRNTLHYRVRILFSAFLQCAQWITDTLQYANTAHVLCPVFSPVLFSPPLIIDTPCTYRVLCLRCCSVAKVDNGWIVDNWITAALFFMKILHNCIVSHC